MDTAVVKGSVGDKTTAATPAERRSRTVREGSGGRAGKVERVAWLTDCRAKASHWLGWSTAEASDAQLAANMASRPASSATDDKRVKRTVRNYGVVPAMTTEEESRETAISDSEFESDRSASPVRKLPSRSGAGSAASKRKRVETSPKLSETEDRTSEGTVAGSDSKEKITRKKKQKKIPELDQLGLELKQLDTVDLTLKHKEATDNILMVATTSNNLKGTFVKKLKIAARTADMIGEELHK